MPTFSIFFPTPVLTSFSVTSIPCRPRLPRPARASEAWRRTASRARRRVAASSWGNGTSADSKGFFPSKMARFYDFYQWYVAMSRIFSEFFGLKHHLMDWSKGKSWPEAIDLPSVGGFLQMVPQTNSGTRELQYVTKAQILVPWIWYLIN